MELQKRPYKGALGNEILIIIDPDVLWFLNITRLPNINHASSRHNDNQSEWSPPLLIHLMSGNIYSF